MFTFRVDDLSKMNEKLRAFAEFLRSENIADNDVFFCRLVSCELISNVIRHGGEAAEFNGGIGDGKVVITVVASSFDGVSLTSELPDVLAENGRGMYIVRNICSGEVEKLNGGVRVTYKLNK